MRTLHFGWTAWIWGQINISPQPLEHVQAAGAHCDVCAAAEVWALWKSEGADYSTHTGSR